LLVFRIVLHFGIIFTHIYLFAIGEKIKGLIFHSQVSVFGDSCQRGRKYEPKAKGPHHHRIFKNIVFNLNTKRRISLRGSFVYVKGKKAFETGGENFKS
jgi:hypothetical protein